MPVMFKLNPNFLCLYIWSDFSHSFLIVFHLKTFPRTAECMRTRAWIVRTQHHNFLSSTDSAIAVAIFYEMIKMETGDKNVVEVFALEDCGAGNK